MSDERDGRNPMVIPLDPDRGRAVRVRRRVESLYPTDGDACAHRRKVVDQRLRRVECEDCDETLDAIESLIEIIRWIERREDEWERIRQWKQERKEEREAKQERRHARRQIRWCREHEASVRFQDTDVGERVTVTLPDGRERTGRSLAAAIRGLTP